MRSRILILLAVTFLLLALVPAALAQEGPGDPERGGQLYVENCAVCHGVDGQGRIGASLEGFSGIEPATAMESVIASGVPGSVMPAWGQANGGPLSEKDILDIASYVLATFAGTQPILPLPTYVAPTIERLPEVQGNPSAGALVYQANCAMCHGDRGQGRFGLPLAKSWPVTEPATYIRQVARQGIAGTTMPAWAQANGGPLTEEEIGDVAAFILRLDPAAAATPIPPSAGPMGTTPTLLLLCVLALGVVIALILYYRRPRSG